MIGVEDVVAMLRARGARQLVAIDGLPVSGKSTLAERLEAELGAATLYLDDFVRPEVEWRGTSRPGFPFPYIRHDAFCEAVRALARGNVARFQRYDWASGALAENWSEIQPGAVTLVEGVSALQAELAPLYSLRLWVESDAQTTLEAALARGVGDWAREWRDLFMPSVDLYMSTAPQQRADFMVSGRGVMGA